MVVILAKFILNSGGSRISQTGARVPTPVIAGSLESANSSILAVRRLFKDFGGKKSGFYDN